MVIKLFNNLITIADEQQFETVKIDNYKTNWNGVPAGGGIYMFDVSKDNKTIISIRTNNLVVIDNRI